MKNIALSLSALTFLAIHISIPAQKIELNQFNKIDVSSQIDIELIVDKTCGIEWTLKNISQDKIIAEVKDQTLRIKTKTGIYKDAVIKAKVYITDLSMITSSRRANVWSEEDLYFENISFILSNGGETRLKIHADTLAASIAEGSIIYLKGETIVLDVKVGTGATFSGYDFVSEEATVLANSGGKAKVAVKKYLKATAAVMGFIGYIGEPEKIEKDATSGGEIIQTVKE